MFKKNAGKAVLCVLAAGPFVVKDSINTGAIGLSTLLGIGATAWNWGGKALKMLDTFAAKGMGYQYSFWFLSCLKNKAVDFYDWLKHNINKTTFRKPEEFKEKFREGCKKIKGQENAKKDVMNFGLEICHAKNEAEMKKEKRKGADVILFTGTSGCGKSMMAEVFANAISTAPAFVVSSGDIDISSKVPIVEQLFGERRSSVGYGGYRRGGGYEGPNEKNCLISYIERVKHGVVIINEYDKMHSNPPKDKKDENDLDPLDELLRAFADKGDAFVCGKKVDASNITFILTSNEKLEVKVANEEVNSTNTPVAGGKDLPEGVGADKDSLKSKNTVPLDDFKNETVKKSVDSEGAGSGENRVPSLEKLGGQDKETVGKTEKIKSGENSDIKNEKEKSKGIDSLIKKADKVKTIEKGKTEDLSRTDVKREQSFFYRIAKVEFEHLKLADLEEIVKDQYGENMVSYWKEYANIDLDLSKIYEPVARKASTMPEHGRAVRNIMRNLTGLLSNTFEAYLEKSKDKNNKPEKVVVSYDEKAGNFSIKTPISNSGTKTRWI